MFNHVLSKSVQRFKLKVLTEEKTDEVTIIIIMYLPTLYMYLNIVFSFADNIPTIVSSPSDYI